jgi:hypothetical protein
MTWNEWVEQVAIESAGRIDLSGIAEEDAKITCTQSYGYFTSGCSPSAFVSERLSDRDSGKSAVSSDPDDESDWYDE